MQSRTQGISSGEGDGSEGVARKKSIDNALQTTQNLRQPFKQLFLKILDKSRRSCFAKVEGPEYR